ncbi:hypothetical protein [Crateriforma conspicua]|uniref:Uncharacterized protein n=1 Tax=Crateriforma conspicua TaxID=2527996 RepID=A0A5C6FXS1_9PLAN|nr:hypothetical protein [Crateriforma conspicua]TWU66435.1 hypothetical protein V7x_20010 [Crateriforma conspicua]
MRFAMLIFAATLVASGCDQVDWSQLDGVFDDGGYVQPQTPSYPTDSPNVCPPDGCPNCPVQSMGNEVMGQSAAEVNEEAAAEIKGQCPTCPQSVTRPVRTVTTPTVHTRASARPPTIVGAPPIRLNPGEVFLGFGPIRSITTTQQPSPAAPRTMPGPERPAPVLETDCVDGSCPLSREGVFVCQRCGKPTVGEGWHELWADDGTPLTCLCDDCWDRLSPTERAKELIRYARGAVEAKSLSPIVMAAIKSSASEGTRRDAAPTLPSYGTEF